MATYSAPGGIAHQVGGNTTINNGSVGPVGAQSDATSSAEQQQKVVLVLVAKDKEWTKMKQHLKETFEIADVRHDALPNIDNVTAPCGKHTLMFAVLEGEGKAAVEKKAKEIIKKLKPTHVSTIGFCGGREEQLSQVLMFTKARWLAKKDGKDIIHEEEPADKTKVMETWRVFEQLCKDDDDPVIAVKPPKHGELIVFSSRDPQATDTAEALLELLNERKVDGLDMEIAFLWRVVEQINVGREASKQVVSLPAFKGVSDAGSKEIRDGETGDLALHNAAKVFAFYIRAFLGVDQ